MEDVLWLINTCEGNAKLVFTVGSSDCGSTYWLNYTLVFFFLHSQIRVYCLYRLLHVITWKLSCDLSTVVIEMTSQCLLLVFRLCDQLVEFLHYYVSNRSSRIYSKTCLHHMMSIPFDHFESYQCYWNCFTFQSTLRKFESSPIAGPCKIAWCLQLIVLSPSRNSHKQVISFSFLSLRAVLIECALSLGIVLPRLWWEARAAIYVMGPVHQWPCFLASGSQHCE